MKRIIKIAAFCGLLLLAAGCKNQSSEATSEPESAMPDTTQVKTEEVPAEVEAVAEEKVEEVVKEEKTNTKDMSNEVNNKVTGDIIVNISTTKGDIKVRLYGDTPRHRDNFVKLAKEGFYNGVLFHRVINEFMVQTGDPESKNAPKGKMLGSGDPGYTLEAEFVYPKYFHKRGALAAARQGDQVNPQRRSSGSQFYIVTGKVYGSQEMSQLDGQLQMAQQQAIFQRLAGENMDKIRTLQSAGDREGLLELQNELIAITEAEAAQNPAKLTEAQRTAYSTVGGTPHLDGQYTVFGEVITGMEVVDAIQKVATDRNDRPNEDIKITKVEVEE